MSLSLIQPTKRHPQLECCGITGPDNYNAYEPRLNPSFSCCPDDGTDRASEIKRSDCLSLEKYYKEGCETKVLGTVHSAGLTVIVCGILFCFLEVSYFFNIFSELLYLLFHQTDRASQSRSII